MNSTPERAPAPINPQSNVRGHLFDLDPADEDLLLNMEGLEGQMRHPRPVVDAENQRPRFRRRNGLAPVLAPAPAVAQPPRRPLGPHLMAPPAAAAAMAPANEDAADVLYEASDDEEGHAVAPVLQVVRTKQERLNGRGTLTALDRTGFEVISLSLTLTRTPLTHALALAAEPDPHGQADCQHLLGQAPHVYGGHQ